LIARLADWDREDLADAEMRAALGDEDAAKDALFLRMRIDMRQRRKAKEAREEEARLMAEARKIIPFPKAKVQGRKRRAEPWQ